MLKLLLAAVLTVFGVYMLVADVQERRDATAFRSRGETAKVLLIENAVQHESKWRRRKEVDTTWRGDVTFRTKAGESVTVRQHPLPRTIDRSMGGAGATIWYLPDRPAEIRFSPVADVEETTNPWLTRLFALLLVALGVYSGWRSLQR